MTTPRIVTPPTRASIPTDAAVVLVHAAIAPVHVEPRVSSGQTTQALAAHPLRILARHDDDWLRVRGADGYEGWIHRGYVALPGDLGVTDPTSWPGEARTSLGASVSQPGGLQRALPLGAWLRPDEEVLAGEALLPRERQARFAPDGAAIARTAVERFAGTPYQWGGLTPWGADCSGLAQTAFGLHGVPLPRDAYQQAECGVDAGRDPLALAAGDLLFFSDRPDGHITHVGVALGERRMVHLALGRGGYAVEDLGDAADGYVAALVRRFVGARRVVGA
ncbi:MAG TPA: SH3 domain-containing C40 family peptidase [Gemmatimonadaceae bacterium]|nr:SH3 domain-containing C40 family peptidase [Gemmatimonadaceae bacterium]